MKTLFFAFALLFSVLGLNAQASFTIDAASAAGTAVVAQAEVQISGENIPTQAYKNGNAYVMSWSTSSNKLVKKPLSNQHLNNGSPVIVEGSEVRVQSDGVTFFILVKTGSHEVDGVEYPILKKVKLKATE